MHRPWVCRGSGYLSIIVKPAPGPMTIVVGARSTVPIRIEHMGQAAGGRTG